MKSLQEIIDLNQYVGLTMSGLARRASLPQVKTFDIGPVQRLDARFECERRMIDFGFEKIRVVMKAGVWHYR